ncbi:hypothetical protein Bbelb_375770 [Branchiostoma belcheri]|nr:hypothetical protein Bbelb_375770 [Branchiostoma belcheri]
MCNTLPPRVSVATLSSHLSSHDRRTFRDFPINTNLFPRRCSPDPPAGSDPCEDRCVTIPAASRIDPSGPCAEQVGLKLTGTRSAVCQDSNPGPLGSVPSRDVTPHDPNQCFCDCVAMEQSARSICTMHACHDPVLIGSEPSPISHDPTLVTNEPSRAEY